MKFIFKEYYLTNGKVYKESELIDSWGTHEQKEYLRQGNKLYLLVHRWTPEYPEDDTWDTEKIFLGEIKSMYEEEEII